MRIGTAPAALTRLWAAGAAVGAAYGAVLIVAAVRLPAGSALTGQFPGQPVVKALMAVLLAAAAVVVVACALLLVWFWPHLTEQGLALPVTVYIAVLGAMVCAALLARLPSPWTALGAVCFAVSDGMIGISEFIRHDQLLAVPIWWAYAISQVLITAGFFFGRSSGGPATPVR